MINNLDWILDEGTLYIDGEGTLDDMKQNEETFPWSEQKDEVESIVIGIGIRSVGAWNFAGYPALKEVVLQKGFTRVHHHAFKDCPQLNSVVFPKETQLRMIFEKDKFLGWRDIPESVIYFGIGSFVGTPFAAEYFGDFYIRHNTLFFVFSQEDTLTIPDGVTEITGYAFDHTPSVVNVPDSVEILDLPQYPFLPRRVPAPEVPETPEPVKKKATRPRKKKAAAEAETPAE